MNHRGVVEQPLASPGSAKYVIGFGTEGLKLMKIYLKIIAMLLRRQFIWSIFKESAPWPILS